MSVSLQIGKSGSESHQNAIRTPDTRPLLAHRQLTGRLNLISATQLTKELNFLAGQTKVQQARPHWIVQPKIELRPSITG
jgi:hypothetical protein